MTTPSAPVRFARAAVFAAAALLSLLVLSQGRSPVSIATAFTPASPATVATGDAFETAEPDQLAFVDTGPAALAFDTEAFAPNDQAPNSTDDAAESASPEVPVAPATPAVPPEPEPSATVEPTVEPSLGAAAKAEMEPLPASDPEPAAEAAPTVESTPAVATTPTVEVEESLPFVLSEPEEPADPSLLAETDDLLSSGSLTGGSSTDLEIKQSVGLIAIFGNQTGTSVDVTPDDDLKAMVKAAAEGTRFRLLAGTHSFEQVVPKAGMWFEGEPGTIIDGRGQAQTAFRNLDGVRDVVIRDMEITGFQGGRYLGAIEVRPSGLPNSGDADYPSTSWTEPTDWLIERVHIHHNDGHGVTISSGTTVRDSRITDNSWGGIHGTLAQRVSIVDSEISRNAAEAQATIGSGNANSIASGIKLTLAKDVVIERNTVHDNYGNGIWMDIAVRDARIESNDVARNQGYGIYYEISYDGQILRNTVVDNVRTNPSWVTGAGIMVATSSRVSVEGNYVEGSPNGVMAIDIADRRGADWFNAPTSIRLEPYATADFRSIGNTICGAENTGLRIPDTYDDTTIYETAVIDGNSYGTGTAFVDRSLWYGSWEQWQAAGRDATGRLIGSCPP